MTMFKFLLAYIKTPFVSRIQIKNDEVVFRIGLLRWPRSIVVDKIKEIRIGQDLDLWDIWTAYVYVEDIVYTFPYYIKGLYEFSQLLNFDKLFGEGWFDRATGKTVLYADRNIMVGSIDLSGQSQQIREAETLLVVANPVSKDYGKDDRPPSSPGDDR